MFSKTEKDYLLGKITPNFVHKRMLNHRIKNKIKEFYLLELPLIQSVTEFSNAITEFSNTSINHKRKQSLGRDTNPRPNAYEAFALPG